MQWKNQKPLLSLSAGLKKATRKHVSPGLVMCASSWFYSRICLLLSLTGRKKMTVQGLMSLSSFDKKAKGWELFIKAIYKRGGKPGQSWLCSKFQVPLLLLVPHADGSIHKGTSCKLYVRFCFGHVNIAHFTSHLTFIFFCMTCSWCAGDHLSVWDHLNALHLCFVSSQVWEHILLFVGLGHEGWLGKALLLRLYLFVWPSQDLEE